MSWAKPSQMNNIGKYSFYDSDKIGQGKEDDILDLLNTLIEHQAAEKKQNFTILPYIDEEKPFLLKVTIGHSLNPKTIDIEFRLYIRVVNGNPETNMKYLTYDMNCVANYGELKAKLYKFINECKHFKPKEDKKIENEKDNSNKIKSDTNSKVDTKKDEKENSKEQLKLGLTEKIIPKIKECATIIQTVVIIIESNGINEITSYRSSGFTKEINELISTMKTSFINEVFADIKKEFSKIDNNELSIAKGFDICTVTESSFASGPMQRITRQYILEARK